jgi:hypothetical protein
MIDFAIDLQRREGLNSHDAILQGVPAAFPSHHDDRPPAPSWARLPLAIGPGPGLGAAPAALAFPSWVDCSQPDPDALHHAVVFLYMDRFGDWTSGFWNRWYHGIMGDKPEDHLPSRRRPSESCGLRQSGRTILILRQSQTLSEQRSARAKRGAISTDYRFGRSSAPALPSLIWALRL